MTTATIKEDKAINKWPTKGSFIKERRKSRDRLTWVRITVHDGDVEFDVGKN